MSDLSVNNFFQNYITHPLSKELSSTDKKVALIASILIGIITLGMAHLGSYFYQKHCNVQTDPNPNSQPKPNLNYLPGSDLPTTPRTESAPAPTPSNLNPVATPATPPPPSRAVRNFYERLTLNPQSFCAAQEGQVSLKDKRFIQELMTRVTGAGAGAGAGAGPFTDIETMEFPQELDAMPRLFDIDRNTSEFNRLVTERRSQYEAKLVENITKDFPDTSIRLNLVSYFAGGGLQEFIIIGKLAKLGYSDIHLSLIPDPSNSDSVDQTKIQLDAFYNQMPTLRVSIDKYVDVKTYKEANTTNLPHAVWAVDLKLNDLYIGDTTNRTWTNLLRLRSLLNDRGQLYLATPLETLTMSKSGVGVIYGGIRRRNENQCHYRLIKMNLAKFTDARLVNISYYCRNPVSAVSSLMPYLVALKELKVAKVNIRVKFQDLSLENSSRRQVQKDLAKILKSLVPGINVEIGGAAQMAVNLKINEKVPDMGQGGSHSTIDPHKDEILKVDCVVHTFTVTRYKGQPAIGYFEANNQVTHGKVNLGQPYDFRQPTS